VRATHIKLFKSTSTRDSSILEPRHEFILQFGACNSHQTLWVHFLARLVDTRAATQVHSSIRCMQLTSNPLSPLPCARRLHSSVVCINDVALLSKYVVVAEPRYSGGSSARVNGARERGWTGKARLEFAAFPALLSRSARWCLYQMIDNLKQELHERMPIDRTLIIQFVRGYRREKDWWEATKLKLSEALVCNFCDIAICAGVAKFSFSNSGLERGNGRWYHPWFSYWSRKGLLDWRRFELSLILYGCVIYRSSSRCGRTTFMVSANVATLFI